MTFIPLTTFLYILESGSFKVLQSNILHVEISEKLIRVYPSPHQEHQRKRSALDRDDADNDDNEGDDDGYDADMDRGRQKKVKKHRQDDRGGKWHSGINPFQVIVTTFNNF